MLKPRWVTKVKLFFLVLVYVFNFNLLEFSATILQKGLLSVFPETTNVEVGEKNKETLCGVYQNCYASNNMYFWT